MDSPAPRPKPSFYKRQLPDSCVAFSSKEGKKIFASALTNSGLKSFFALIQQFTTQTEPAYCGLSTLVLVLNALSVDPQQTWKGPWRWFSEEMLNCCVSLEEVQKSGITLQDFRCLAICQGLTVNINYADETDDDGLKKFQQAVEKACIQNPTGNDDDDDAMDTVLVVSYSRKVLGQTGSGHFSPIAAYDKESDQVLILDTARFKYGAHWTKLELLYDAMQPIDKDTGKSRGYALMSFQSASSIPYFHQAQSTPNSSSVQPVSLLFASRLKQSPARQQYKQFLESLSRHPTWDEVLEYWSGKGDECSSQIWEILDPLSHPKEGAQKAAVQNLQAVLQDLLETDYPVPAKCCQSQNHKTCAGSQQALLVIYLASMNETCRKNIVKNVKAESLTKDQLLNEATLIACAIEISDQNDLCCTRYECKGCK